MNLVCKNRKAGEQSIDFILGAELVRQKVTECCGSTGVSGAV